MEDGGGGHTGIQDLVPYIHPIILACILFSIFYEWSSKSNVSILYIITLVLGLLFYWPDPSAPYSKRDLNNLQAESYKQAQDFFAREKSKPVNQSVNRFSDKVRTRSASNLAQLHKVISETLDLLESSTKDGKPSAKQIVLSGLAPYFNASKEEAATWSEDYDYAKSARILIFNIAFDELSTGKYNLGTGFINPMGEGVHLQFYVQSCLNWSFDRGYITEQERDETLTALRKNISSVG